MKRTTVWNLTIVAVLALGVASLAWAGDGHDGSTTGSGQVQGSDDKGGQKNQPGDDKGGAAAKPTDDGGNHIEPGDDHGSHVEPGDDKGGAQSNSSTSASTEFRVRRKLVPVMGSPVMDASGRVVIRAQGARQRFHVEVEAMVPDGTTFLVLADGNLAGSVMIQMGEGELELDTEDGDLPEGLDPVTAIKMVTVTDAGGVVLLQGRV